MAEANIVSEAGGDAAEGRTANLIYILYLLNLILGVTSFIGVIMAYVNKGGAPEWVQSHYRFQIRTFWIGLLIGVTGAVTAAFVVGILILAFLFIWWIARCITGMRYYSEGRAHPNPTSWMFG